MIKLAKHKGKAEIFYTIQGEGKNMGKPSIFVRTSLCNLHCVWCDTDYTWNWENTPFKTVTNKKFKREEYIIEQSAEKIAKIISDFPCKHVVLTGGEPLMHDEELVALIDMLQKQSKNQYSFEIETNGTLIPSEALDKNIDQYNVSPKLANSHNSKKIREKPRALAFFSHNPKAYFKFVISEAEDLDEVVRLVEKYHIKPEHIYLMPEGTNRATLSKKRQWLIEICKNYGYHYTDRLHVEVYGAKRGV
ncbi:MAG: 7-carboxy-7-deazaguanine synthase QueE [Fulvivirga sp.]|nr:7-carboxy-7-deazaguanine synthase QueE [Fulvivirga sp.]